LNVVRALMKSFLSDVHSTRFELIPSDICRELEKYLIPDPPPCPPVNGHWFKVSTDNTLGSIFHHIKRRGYHRVCPNCMERYHVRDIYVARRARVCHKATCFARYTIGYMREKQFYGRHHRPPTIDYLVTTDFEAEEFVL
jgi:hypothetical protein